jgi:hypothetical protein
MSAGQPTSGLRGRDRRRRSPAPAGLVSLTVCVDRAMHARLRALAARQQRSHQDIVEGALDAYLNVFGAGCACVGDAKPKA